MDKFKGKFQHADCCCRNIGFGRRITEYEAGWEYYVHCSCHICELRREEDQKDKCVDKCCEGCQNLASGKKVRDWFKDLCKDVDKVKK